MDIIDHTTATTPLLLHPALRRRDAMPSKASPTQLPPWSSPIPVCIALSPTKKIPNLFTLLGASCTYANDGQTHAAERLKLSTAAAATSGTVHKGMAPTFMDIAKQIAFDEEAYLHD